MGNKHLAKYSKIGKHLNPKGGKMRIQPTTLNQIAFGHFFVLQSFHKGVILSAKCLIFANTKNPL
jgi:hypothetical protein